MRARTGCARLALVAFCAAGVVVARPSLADSALVGRKHASKANQLAAKNKCKAAVVEFGKAYKALKDPTLLFNRAECYRRLGRDADALKDYQQFLVQMPAAPNRKDVEDHIASLKTPAGPEKAAAPAEPVPPPAPAAVPASPKPAPGAPAPAASAEPAAGMPPPPAAKPVPPAEAPQDKPPVRRAEKWTD